MKWIENQKCFKYFLSVDEAPSRSSSYYLWPFFRKCVNILRGSNVSVQRLFHGKALKVEKIFSNLQLNLEILTKSQAVKTKNIHNSLLRRYI